MHKIVSLLMPFHILDWRFIITSYVPVAVNVLALCLTYVIVRYTSRAAKASEESASAAKESADASVKSADAAVESARLTKESLEVVQRAYVTLKSFTVATMPNPNVIPSFGVILVNAGATPAIDGVLSAECCFTDVANTSGPSVFPFSTPPKRVTLAPQHEHVEFVSQQLQGQELAEFRAGKKAFLIWGKLQYKDVFKAKHTTTFCGVFSICGMRITPFHNEID